MINLIKNNKILVLTLSFFLVAIVFTIFLLRLFTTQDAVGGDQAINPTPFAEKGSDFKVTSTSPLNGALNIYPGEIKIVFSTDVALSSVNSFRYVIEPQLADYSEIISTFPTQTVNIQIYGGLLPKTTYTVTIYKSGGSLIHSWSFSTSNEGQRSSSGEVDREEQDYNDEFFPLFDYVPFGNDLFEIDYTSALTLEVSIRTGTLEDIRRRTEIWIAERGVDPSTHSINYIQN